VLGLIAKRTGYCDRFGNVRVNKVSMTTLAAAIDETGSFKVRNKLSQFRRHQVILCGFGA
jgi:hypothetical protein